MLLIRQLRMEHCVPRKSKKQEVADAAKKSKTTQIDIAIEERLAGCGRNEEEHIIYVGQLVERILKGEFGAVIKALTVGRISSELASSKSGSVSSDRILGRLEMAEHLWNDLELYVLDKDKLLAPVKNDGVQFYNYAP